MDTEDLLRMTPADAITAMVNWENVTAFNPGILIPSELVVIDGTTTQVLLTVRRAYSDVEELPAPGSFLFTYERLNVADHFEDVLGSYRPPMPSSTQELLDEITARTGQLFYPEDFELDYIDRENADPYILRAKPESLRWVGTIPITVGEYPNLAVYLADATGNPFGQINQTLALATQEVSFSPINATPKKELLSRFPTGGQGPGIQDLLELVNHVVGGSPHYIVDGLNAWVNDPLPKPYNLRNAQVADVAMPIAGTVHAHPFNPRLDTAVVIDLDLTLCTNFTEARLYLPYQLSHFADSQFTDRPRFRAVGVRGISEGSAHNLLLNTFVLGDIISALPPGGLMLSGPEPWVANSGLLSRTNLYNAVVQYNGQRRAQDIPPAYTGLNRVLVVSVDEQYNAAYRGNLAFHYRAPIFLSELITPAHQSIPYVFDFSPSQGVAPYNVQLVSGTLPAGLSIAANRLEGTTAVRGNFTFTVSVTDAAGTVVRYTYRLTVLD